MQAARAEPLGRSTPALRGGWIGPLLSLLGGVYAGVALLRFPHWVMDDAYILFRYASNLASSGQPVWNVGQDRVEGYTGFALMVLVAAGDRLGLPPEVTGHLVGLLSFGLAALMLELLLRALGVRGLFRGVALLLYLTAPFLYTNAYSGLETMLFSASVLGSLYLLARYQRSTKPVRWLAALCAALLFTSLVRPEGALLAGIVLGVLLLRSLTGDRSRLGQTLLGILGYMLPALAYFVWRARYYGELLPNTFYVKASRSLLTPDSLWAEVGFIKTYWLVPCLAIVAAALIFGRRHRPSAALGPLAVVILSASIFTTGLLAFYAHAQLIQDVSYRFLVPLFGLGLLAMALAAERVMPGSNGSLSWLACALPAVLVAVQLVLQVSGLPAEAGFAADYRRVLTSEHIPAGTYLKTHLPRTQWLAVYLDAGAIPYVSGLPSIDMGGLNDRTLADQGLSIHSRLDYLFSHQPGAIVITSTRLDRVARDAEAAAISADPRFTANYHLVQALAPGLQLYGRPYYELVFVRNDLQV